MAIKLTYVGHATYFLDIGNKRIDAETDTKVHVLSAGDTLDL